MSTLPYLSFPEGLQSSRPWKLSGNGCSLLLNIYKWLYLYVFISKIQYLYSGPRRLPSNWCTLPFLDRRRQLQLAVIILRLNFFLFKFWSTIDKSFQASISWGKIIFKFNINKFALLRKPNSLFKQHAVVAAHCFNRCNNKIVLIDVINKLFAWFIQDVYCVIWDQTAFNSIQLVMRCIANSSLMDGQIL